MMMNIEGFKQGVENFVTNWNNFFATCGNIYEFFHNCFTEERFLIDLMKKGAPDIILIALLILIILNFLGFEKTSKYISLTLVIAVILAII